MSDEWQDWNGEDRCPVAPSTLVELKFRHGRSTCKTSCPEQWRWTDTDPKRGSEYDIVAYRAIRRGAA